MIIVCVLAKDWWGEIRVLSADLPGWRLPIPSEGAMFGVHPEALSSFLGHCGELAGVSIQGAYYID